VTTPSAEITKGYYYYYYYYYNSTSITHSKIWKIVCSCGLAY